MTAFHVMHPRATRFPLEAPVRFKGIGEACWHTGLTVNASRTGVLLRSVDARVAPCDRVEFILTLPRVEGAHAGVEVRCHGGVARLEGAAGPTQKHATTVALTIDDEEFGRSERERLTARPQAGQNDA
jgi:hypothetical protein